MDCSPPDAPLEQQLTEGHRQRLQPPSVYWQMSCRRSFNEEAETSVGQTLTPLHCHFCHFRLLPLFRAASILRSFNAYVL